MRTVKHLDKDDLVFILADYFDVREVDVKVIPFIDIEGSGMGEHEVASIKVEVDVTDMN